ncbi:uncharacterized protein LOC144347783 [Saccoglossus kowalevskii]
MSTEYHIIVATKNSIYSAHGAVIKVQLVGTTVTTDPLLLQSLQDSPNDPLFQTGNKDHFKVKALNIEEIKQIKIGFDSTGFVEGWTLKWVIVENVSTNKKFFFEPDSYFRNWSDGILKIPGKMMEMRSVDEVDDDKREEDDIEFLMGPILGIKSLAIYGEYQLCCLVVTKSEFHSLPQLKYECLLTEVTGATRGVGDASVLTTWRDRRLWRYDWSVPRHKTQEVECMYTLPDNRTYTCVVPAINAPPRFALLSNSDMSSQTEKMKYIGQVNTMWRHLRKEHEKTPFHLLIMAGDQVYGDEIVTKMPSLIEWANTSKCDRTKADFTDEMEKECHEFYFNLYYARWREPEPAWVYARIPSLMMWDDHDVIVGYGCMVSCPVIDGMYEIARKYFILFQLRGLREDKDWNRYDGGVEFSTESGLVPAADLVWVGFKFGSVDHSSCRTVWVHPDSRNKDRNKYISLSYVVKFGDSVFLFLDGRSERTSRHILSARSWKEISQILKKIHRVKHLFVVACVPPIFTSTSLLPSAGNVLPWRKEWEKDHADSWDAMANFQVERIRLFTILADFSLKKQTRVSILSGDVHAACWGKLHTETGVVINMPTSSPMVDRPLSLLGTMIGKLTTGVKNIDVPGHGKSLASLIPIGQEKNAPILLDTNNFMTFTPCDDKGELAYETQVIARTSMIFSDNTTSPAVFTNYIRPFRLDMPTVDVLGCSIV